MAEGLSKRQPASSFRLGTLVLEETSLGVRNIVILRRSFCDGAKASGMGQTGGETEGSRQPSPVPVTLAWTAYM